MYKKAVKRSSEEKNEKPYVLFILFLFILPVYRFSYRYCITTPKRSLLIFNCENKDCCVKMTPKEHLVEIMLCESCENKTTEYGQLYSKFIVKKDNKKRSLNKPHLIHRQTCTIVNHCGECTEMIYKYKEYDGNKIIVRLCGDCVRGNEEIGAIDEELGEEVKLLNSDE